MDNFYVLNNPVACSVYQERSDGTVLEHHKLGTKMELKGLLLKNFREDKEANRLKCVRSVKDGFEWINQTEQIDDLF